jgi:hypothetical protein
MSVGFGAIMALSEERNRSLEYYVLNGPAKLLLSQLAGAAVTESMCLKEFKCRNFRDRETELRDYSILSSRASNRGRYCSTLTPVIARRRRAAGTYPVAKKLP